MMEVIKIPHKFITRNYQKGLFDAIRGGVKRAVYVAHRRSGKDKTAWNIIIDQALKRKGTYFYFLPTYSQAKKIIWDGADKEGFRFLDHVPKDAIKSKYETELKLELINGSIIQLVGSDNIDRIVGTNPIGVVFSEYSLMKPNVWDFIRPILAENDGWAIFIFTPRGMNHGWQLLQQSRDSEDWYSCVLTVEDTGAIPEKTLDKERDEMPQDLFEQEYYCKFIEAAGQFFRRVDQNVVIVDPEPDPHKKYQIGIDLGKYQDYTVVTVLDLMNFHVVHVERFNQMDYNLQKAKIEAISLRYYNPMGWIDSTGVGEPIYDDLTNRRLRLQPFVFTEKSRTNLLVNLQLKLEQGLVKIPENEQLISELKSMRYELTKMGKTKPQVPEGLHDDMIMSLALACWELPKNRLPKKGSLVYLEQQVEDNTPETSYE